MRYPATQRRTLLRSALNVCAFAFASGAPAFGQLALEFKSSEYRGRIDRPSTENIWVLGDNNGNGVLDENESFGPRIELDQAFPTGIGRGLYELAPTNAFGSAMVAFDDPYNLMLGFIDVVDSFGGGYQPDGLADDVDVDGQFSPDGFDTEDPRREPDVIAVGMPPDYGDLVRLPVSFQSLGVSEFANMGGAHLMHVFTFEGDPEFTLSTTHETVELGLGARFLSNSSDLRVSGSGGVMGDSKWDSFIETQSLGPQASLWWTLQKGRWQARVGGAAALTYMEVDGDQRVELGQDLVPGQYNRPLYMAPVQTDNRFESWDIAPVLEASVRASYDVTPTTQCFVRGDLLQFGDIRNARDAIVYELPRMGIYDPGGYDVTITAYSIGVEVRR
jgi:hypothetical protein